MCPVRCVTYVSGRSDLYSPKRPFTERSEDIVYAVSMGQRNTTATLSLGVFCMSGHLPKIRGALHEEPWSVGRHYVTSLVAEGDDGVYLGGAAGWEVAGQGGYGGQD
jgi:hypothetical protein